MHGTVRHYASELIGLSIVQTIFGATLKACVQTLLDLLDHCRGGCVRGESTIVVGEVALNVVHPGCRIT